LLKVFLLQNTPDQRNEEFEISRSRYKLDAKSESRDERNLWKPNCRRI